MKYCSFDDSIVWFFFDRVNHELKILRRHLTRLFSRPSFCKMSRRIYVTEFFWRTNKWRRLRSWVNSSSVSTFLVSGVIAAFYRCIQHFFLLLKLCVYVYFHDSVVPSVSFRPVYTGLDTVGLLLTKTTNHIQGISLWSKTLFQALCLAGAPLHFFLQADYSNNPFYYFLFPFFCLVAREVIATSSTETQFLYFCVRHWHGNDDKNPQNKKTARSVSLV